MNDDGSAGRARHSALRLLARREHSQYELRRKLKARGYGERLVDELLAELITERFLSDTRYAAAKQLGMEFVPYIELNHLDDMDVRKYRLADNRVADESEWDKNLLRNELAELELNSKLDAEWWKKTGFNQEEIAKVLAGTLQETKEDFKEVGESLETPHKCPKCGYAW